MTPRWEIQIVRPQDGKPKLWDRYPTRERAESVAATLRKHGIWCQVRRGDDETPTHDKARRQFLVFCVAGGFLKPDTLTRRIVAEVESEVHE